MRRFTAAVVAALTLVLLPAPAGAKPISKPKWLNKVTVTEYYPVPEKWFVGARRPAPGLPGTHRVDWLYGAAGLFMEGDGIDLQGRRVHLRSTGKPGWVDRRGRKTFVGNSSKPIFWRNYGWRASRNRVTFPLEGGGWYRGLLPRKYSKPAGVRFAPGPSLPLRYWRSIAVDRSLIPRNSRVYVPAYRDKPGGGWMRAIDTGSAIKGRHIDVYRPAPASQGGAMSRRNQRIYVIPPKKKPPARAAQAPGAPLSVTEAKLVQHAFKLEAHVKLAGKLRTSDLTGTGRSLCLAFAGSASPPQRLCIQRDRLVLIPAQGPVRHIRSRIKVGAQAVRVRFRYAAKQIRPGSLRWRVVTYDTTCVPPRTGCRASFPVRSDSRLRVVEPYAVSCRRKGRSVVTRGSRRAKRIAITFDDGPSGYTPQVLRMLRRHGAKGTFYMVGQQARAYPGHVRAIQAAGHELANHSYTHARLPSFTELGNTSNVVQKITGFRPCTFRPPYGAIDGRLTADARRLGMTSVLWDVDPSDWRAPGTLAIQQRVLRTARAGSIILLHDAGGSRAQTVAALPAILGTLTRRGYKFVPVRDLLGYKTVYAPR